jgi:PTH1 family peptidyl-tRNA hydrolase
MSYIIAALGNPGDDYKETRHNTGRIIADSIIKKYSFSDFKENPKIKALVSKGEIEGEKVEIVFPDNFMNRSGGSLASLITSVKKAHNLIVIYDDLDLGLGTIKISYNRSSGGHRGLESIIKAIKTQEFIRIRVGISPVSPTGKIKKPSGEKDVEKHIIGPFKPAELEVIKKVSKTVTEAVAVIIKESKEAAMTRFN